MKTGSLKHSLSLGWSMMIPCLLTSQLALGGTNESGYLNGAKGQAFQSRLQSESTGRNALEIGKAYAEVTGQCALAPVGKSIATVFNTLPAVGNWGLLFKVPSALLALSKFSEVWNQFRQFGVMLSLSGAGINLIDAGVNEAIVNVDAYRGDVSSASVQHSRREVRDDMANLDVIGKSAAETLAGGGISGLLDLVTMAGQVAVYGKVDKSSLMTPDIYRDKIEYFEKFLKENSHCRNSLVKLGTAVNELYSRAYGANATVASPSVANKNGNPAKRGPETQDFRGTPSDPAFWGATLF